jgi:3-dehydroquinate dehydratase-2
MKNFLILHGPNLNLLGEREPEVYGTMTLDDINEKLAEFSNQHDLTLKFFQSNHEGQLIDSLHENRHWADGCVFNPGAFTHYSYALRDAVASIDVPTVEVHLSDISTREEFRRTSVIEPECVAQVSGLGWKSYLVGLEKLINQEAR